MGGHSPGRRWLSARTLLEPRPTTAGADRRPDRAGLRAGRAHARERVLEATVRRLSCDASIVQIVERDGKPLSVGRKTRSIPPALRRALRSRDGCCQFPGCTQTRHVDAHHLHHWAHGGHTDLTNLVALCRHHHRLVHEGGFTITGAPGALVFHSPSGRRLRPGPSPRRPGCIPIPTASAETVIQPTYDRMDLESAVDALLDFAPPGRREPDRQAA